jgi:O-antigen/teichoic acid export membrane protein
VILLRKLCADISQISYYSIAFSMAERLLIGASTFGSAVSATIFAQFGRDKSRLPSLAASSFRYLALTSIPLHLIFTALSVPALLLLFGQRYTGATMVVLLAPLLCLFKAFLTPAQSLLECSERQGYVIAATVLAGIVDISVAWSLIPAHGAVGACIGNGAAQLTAVGMMWAIAIYLYKIKLPWLQVTKIAFISLLAALAAHFVAERFTSLWSILYGGSASLVVLFGLFYLMRVLEPEDHVRLKMLAGMLPKLVAGPMDIFLLLLIRAEAADEVSEFPLDVNAIPTQSFLDGDEQRPTSPLCQPVSVRDIPKGE